MASTDLSAGGSSLLPTLANGTVDGTLQVTKSDGTFATLLLGGTASATGIKLVPTGGTLTITRGDNGNGTQLVVPSGSILAGVANTSGVYVGVAGLYGGGGSGTMGIITFPTVTTGTVAFSKATGTLTGAAFSFNGDVQIAGAFSGATTVTSTAYMNANLNDTTNSGLGLGSGGTPGIFMAYTGTAGVYKMRNGAGADGTGFLIQGQYTVSKVTNFTSVAADSGTHYNVTAAATATLPTPSLGLKFSYTNVAATALVLSTPSGVINGVGLTGAATRTTSTAFANVDLVCNDGTNWIMRGTTGTWT